MISLEFVDIETAREYRFPSSSEIIEKRGVQDFTAWYLCLGGAFLPRSFRRWRSRAPASLHAKITGTSRNQSQRARITS